jgi:hypothetical protein
MKFLILHALIARLPLSTVSLFSPCSLQNSAGLMVSELHYFSLSVSTYKMSDLVYIRSWFHRLRFMIFSSNSREKNGLKLTIFQVTYIFLHKKHF